MLILVSQDDGAPDQYDLPPPTKEGVLPLSPPADGKSVMTNGHVQKDEADRYAKTGWAPRFGNGQGSLTSGEAEESLLDHTTLLESKLDDRFFGGMYGSRKSRHTY